MVNIPLWIIATLSGHMFNALAFVIDKYLLSKKIPEPRLYSFYIGLLGVIAIVLVPFGVKFLNARLIFLSFASGGLFVLALYGFFRALKTGEASRIPAIVGSLNPVIIFLLSYFYLSERLSVREFFAFILLLAGGLLISLEKKRKLILRGFWMSLLASFLFSLSFVLSKYVFNQTDFLSGFFWMRMGGVIVALVYLLSGKTRVQVRLSFKADKKNKTQVVFFAGQSLGALGFVLINYGVFLASATLVNALQSLQYVFLFIITIILSIFYPRIIKEKIAPGAVFQKIIALFLIALGVFYLK